MIAGKTASVIIRSSLTLNDRIAVSLKMIENVKLSIKMTMVKNKQLANILLYSMSCYQFVLSQTHTGTGNQDSVKIRSHVDFAFLISIRFLH